MSWLLDEDQALKTKLSGYSVTNYADQRQIPVPVFFRFPDPEEVTRTFPNMAIDLVEIVFDPTRAHRTPEYISMVNLVEQSPPPEGFSWLAYDMPLPWMLMYQIATYARQPWHDRQLTAMLFQLFPEEFGSLDMSDIDGTIRRADLQSIERQDTYDANHKRLYRNIFTIGISSELYLGQVTAIQNVSSVTVDVSSVA